MDINNFLFVTTILIAMLALWRHRVIPYEEAKGWKIKFTLTPLAGLILHELLPEYAGFIIAAYWLSLVLLPSILINKAARLSLASRPSDAAALMRKAVILHPFDGAQENLAMLEALGLAQQGLFDEARLGLQKIGNRSPRQREIAAAQSLRLDLNWAELAQRLSRLRELGEMSRQPALLAFYLRALGETGQISLLASEIHRFERTLLRIGLIHQARLFLFAFTGDVDGASRVIDLRLSDFSDDSKDFWTASALQSRGEYAAAAEILGKIAISSDAIIAKAAQLRAARPLPVFAPWSDPLTKAIVDGLRGRLSREAAIEVSSIDLKTRAKATRLIIYANIAVFILEIVLGGAEDEATLIKMGAFIPEVILSGGAGLWRMFAAQFLHFGIIHIAMNMFGLYALGPFVEAALGRVRYAALYLLSGLGGFAAVLLAAKYLHVQGGFYVGASAGVLGVVGATAAIYLRSWLASHTLLAKNRLMEILTIIGLQVVFDSSMPEVSGTAHIGGLITGFLLCALFLSARKSEQKSKS